MSINPFKQSIQYIKQLILGNISKHKEINDEELECLQFGICAIQVKSPRPEELFFR